MFTAQKKLDSALAALESGDYDAAYCLAKEVDRAYYYQISNPEAATRQQMRDAIYLERCCLEMAISRA